MHLGKGLLQVVTANLINLLFSLCNGIILPKFLSIEAYAGLKTFTLYVSYLGILQLGFSEGVYIFLGGKIREDICDQSLITTERTLICFQSVITIIGFIITLFLQDYILLCAVISILPTNMVSFYKMTYQAIGEFKNYRLISNMHVTAMFLLNIFMIFAIKKQNVYWFIGVQLAATVGVWLFFQNRQAYKKVNIKMNFQVLKTEIKKNISLGFAVMLGSFMGIWITSIDRWFVKILCSVEDFAYYSFAVSMLKLINVVISAFSITLFNYFCKSLDREKVRNLRREILIISAGVIAVFYIIDIFVDLYLEEYVRSKPIILIIFAAQFVLTIVNAIYMNIFKALNQQKKYIISMFEITVIAFVLNFVCGILFGFKTTSYAIATLITAIVWLVVCQLGMRQYKMNIREWTFLFLTIVGYFTAYVCFAHLAIIVYLLWIILISIIIFRNEVKHILELIFRLISKKDKMTA